MGIIVKLLSGVMSVLPDSPFQRMIVAIDDSQLLAALNWFIPFDVVISMIQAWAVCMALYYGYNTVKSVVQTVIGKFFS